MTLVAEVAACAESAFDVAECATMYADNSLVVRELAVVASARLLLVIEFVGVIQPTSANAVTGRSPQGGIFFHVGSPRLIAQLS